MKLFDAGTAASVDEKYYATGEDLFPLFVADSARSPDEQLLLQEDAIFSDMADRVIREVAPHLAPERLEGAPLEVILDFTEHLSVVGRDWLVNAFEAVLGDDFCKLFAKPQDRDRVFQMVKHRWGGRPVKFVITGRDHYNAQNPGFYRDTDWFWYGMHGLFAGVRGVDVINRTKRA